VWITGASDCVILGQTVAVGVSVGLGPLVLVILGVLCSTAFGVVGRVTRYTTSATTSRPTTRAIQIPIRPLPGFGAKGEPCWPYGEPIEDGCPRAPLGGGAVCEPDSCADQVDPFQ
jgi:hypothetical protein